MRDQAGRQGFCDVPRGRAGQITGARTLWIFRKYPLACRFAAFVILPLLLAGALVYHRALKSLPTNDGVVTLAGPTGEIRIVRDARGVPSIHAKTDRDAFFAMGYVHAQDRLWQLEVQRRVATGTLSEVFGKASLEQDIWFRTLGLARSAHAAFDALPIHARESLQAYADGINAWIAEGHALPPEFAMLGVRMRPWSPYDSLAWAKVFALNLGGNHRRELERLLVAQAVGPARMRDLFGDPPGTDSKASAAWAASSPAGLAQYVALQHTLEVDLGIGGRSVGSNAWAVSPAHSANGQALLANDPHLALQMPSLWYMAAMRGDRLDVAGATLVGLPVVIFGHNRDIAWGGTNLMADVQDLYLEQVRPGDDGQYAVDGGWAAFEQHEESIVVRRDFPAFLRSELKPVRIRVRSSRHGPIVTDSYPAIGQPAALRWTALDADDTSYAAFLDLDYATDFTSFNGALAQLVAPALNFVYADRRGNIGSVAAGRVPVRSNGDGTLPVPGWNSSYEWRGTIPFAEMPREYNPACGYVVSANTDPAPDGYRYLISRDWAPPARADRIGKVLSGAVAAGRRLGVADMAALQGDEHSEPARRLVQRLLALDPGSDARRRTAFGFLRGWQGDMRADSQAATIFNAWVRQLRRRLVGDELKGYWNVHGVSSYLSDVVDNIDVATLDRLLGEPSGAWCDDRSTPGVVETCGQTSMAALDDALQELMRIDGDSSMESWQWSRLHRTAYLHVPFSGVNILRSVFDRYAGNGGSPDTVNVANYVFDGDHGYVQTFGAGFRQIVSFGPAGPIYQYMNSTGQSGNVASKHYADMVDAFRDVRYATMSAADKRATLTLLPRKGSAP
ncbi:MAG: penicillin acylase family protein [Rhodanobacter sp.]